MFPTNTNTENPNFLHHSETLLKPPFPYDQNPSSSTPQEEEDPPFLYFPSPFLDDHDMPLSQIFAHYHHHHHHQQQQELKLLQPTNGEEPETTNSSPKKKRSVGLKPRKRTGKKDRHSKIKTAQGVRDRRMRLSVQIARKFFDLQDMLGFDKASKTIEWLFSNSKNAIKELSIKHNNVNGGSSSSTECGERVLSAAMEDSSKNEEMKEKREKARAKARERTKEKTMMTMTKQFYHESSNPNNNNNNSLENELGFSSNPNPFLEEEEPINSYIIQEKSSPHEVNNSIASIFECYQNLYGGISADTDSPNSFMGNFLGNWELDTDPRILISPFSGIPHSNI